MAQTKKTILVIDDDIHYAEVVREVLQFEGYQVHLANCERQTIEILDNLPSPDLVLVDCLMPGRGGAQLIRELRKHPSLKNVPIIGVSGLPPHNAAFKEMAEVATRVAEKPFDLNEYVTLVREALP